MLVNLPPCVTTAPCVIEMHGLHAKCTSNFPTNEYFCLQFMHRESDSSQVIGSTRIDIDP